MVQIDSGGLLQIDAVPNQVFSAGNKMKTEENAGNRILNLAIEMKEKFAQDKTIIVSKNINLRLKAQALGICAEDYEASNYKQPSVARQGTARLQQRGKLQIRISEISKCIRDSYQSACVSVIGLFENWDLFGY